MSFDADEYNVVSDDVTFRSTNGGAFWKFEFRSLILHFLNIILGV